MNRRMDTRTGERAGSRSARDADVAALREGVVLNLDNEETRRTSARAIEQAARAGWSPDVYVLRPDRLGTAADPHAFVHTRGVPWRALLDTRECGIACEYSTEAVERAFRGRDLPELTHVPSQEMSL
jgi:hypothetical protein